MNFPQNTANHVPHFQIQNISDFTSVDGSIVSAHLSFSSDGKDFSNAVTLTIGSLAGFTCMFRRVKTLENFLNPKASEFQGPFLIHGDLRNTHTDRIDFVMTVAHIQYSGVENGMAFVVGLQSGRILLFEEQEMKKSSSELDPHFECVWHHRLAYPIHGITATYIYADKIIPELIITTREGLHLFKGNFDIISETAKKRLANICEMFTAGIKEGT